MSFPPLNSGDPPTAVPLSLQEALNQPEGPEKRWYLISEDEIQNIQGFIAMGEYDLAVTILDDLVEFGGDKRHERTTHTGA